MTRIQEKLYFQSVFDAIDQVYKIKTHQQNSSYEERLRASFNKLLIPDWYNHDYTSITTNGLRKTKSHGHVPRVKRNNNNHNNDDTPDTSVSSSVNSPRLSNGTHRHTYRHRSPSRSWSERPPLRHDSTTSSYDTTGSIVNGRRSTPSNGSSTYAPGVQRVAQSSTWYKPRVFSSKITNGNTNGHSSEPPKPLPRYSKIDQERIHSPDSSSPTKPLIATSSIIQNGRYPVKPRTMAQAQLPSEGTNEVSFLDVSLDVLTDGDVTIVQKSSNSQTTEAASTPQFIIDSNMITNLPRTNSLRSVSSEAESYRSAMLPPSDKNLLGTDSSSYASVNDRCLSPSTASYHTALGGDTSSSSSSSMTGYETPTPQFDDDNGTLSSHSSLSDISHTETLEPNTEDLDIVATSTAEQKPIIIPSVNIGMESSSLLSSNITGSSTTNSRSIENTNWYDGSLETCINQTTPIPTHSSELREIQNDEILREVDINAVGDEFFLCSPRTITDDELSNSLSDNKHDTEFDHIQSPTKTSKRIFTMENNHHNNFHYSTSHDPFDFDNNNSSVMITNLDDILIDDDNDDDDDDDDDDEDDSIHNLTNINYRRPIQEDILYEVEHENSLSDHSQNTSSITATDDKTSIKLDPNIDYMPSTDNSDSNDIQQTSILETSLSKEKQSSINDNTILPIYILPPLFTTSQQTSSSLHIDTTDNFQKLDSFIHQFNSLESPSAYTSKIRHRHYSVGSYYDNKTTTVTLNSTHTHYLLGSAPVSPLSRGSTTSNESYYHMHHHSPISYDNISLNTLRRVNPLLESNRHSVSNYDYKRTTDYRASSLNRDENNRTTTITYTSPRKISKSVERTIPVTQTEPAPVEAKSIASPPSTRTSSVTFPHYEIPVLRPKTTLESPKSPPPLPPPRPAIFDQGTLSLMHQKVTYQSPTSPPLSTLFQQEPFLVRPQTSRARARTPPTLPRTVSTEKEQTQNIYQEIDSTLTDDNQRATTTTKTPNADLQFIRGAIERVFDFHGDSTTDASSESSTFYEEVLDNNQNESYSSKTLSKKDSQYPAIEAVQRFYKHKTSSESDKQPPIEQVTNLDDIGASNNSSTSNKLYGNTPPIITPRKDLTKSKSSDNERASSEEVDDTLNDIEDVYYNEEKLKRQTANTRSSHTSNENSPKNLSDAQLKTKKTSQETQTLERQKQMTRTIIPPIDIVTEMFIEREDADDDNGEPDEVSGDMVVFYDDIEIVEHSTSSYSTESDSTSSNSSSRYYSKPVNTTIEPPPPIPARTLKPIHLLNNQQQSPTTINRTYELRKKFDINSVNDMLNRTEYNIGPSVSHRHPSARHFVGKLNNDETSLSRTIPTNEQQQQQQQQQQRTSTKTTLPIVNKTEKARSVIADTNALVKQIQNSLSRNSLHDKQIPTSNLSTSSKDLRAFVSSTYSPSDENLIDGNGMIHRREQTNNYDDQTFKRQARLSKSFHNVSEYNSTDQYPKKENILAIKTQPSKSVENNLNQVSQNQTRQAHIPLNLPKVVASTSFSALQNVEDTARMLSMKWYTGQVNENSEICYNTNHAEADDLLYGYISTHSNRETQALLARLQASNDVRIHAALDDIRSRVAQFDASKSPEDIHVFMRYLETRLRDINNKPSSNNTNGHPQQPDNISVKSRTSSSTAGASRESSSARQLGRQHLRSSGSVGGGKNGHQPPAPPRRTSQSSANQENPANFDDMLNTVLGLPKKGVAALPISHGNFSNRDKPLPLVQTQMTTNTTSIGKNGRDIGKRLFESGTLKDPRLIYDGPKTKEKEEHPLETSV